MMKAFYRIATWLYIQIDIQIGTRPSTWLERRWHNFPEYRPGSIFKSIFELLYDHIEEISIFPNIDMTPFSIRYPIQYSRFYVIRMTMNLLPEYRPGSKFKSIIKSVFALLHGQKEDSTIFPNIDLVRHSDRYSNRYLNRYSSLYTITMRIDIQIDIHPTKQWSLR